MTVIIETMIILFLLLGVFLTLVAAFGVIRLPDVYTRNHAASKSATLGVMFILLSCFLYFYLIEGHFSSRVLLGIAFIFITAPVGGHLISRAAYHSGVKLWGKSVRDDLKNKK
ncbi:monovalent cation/H(+) antiporter subunit G [Bacillus badius]|uniref:Na(+) H(+) antiporter subunit G n=1 Tax=Bacillus badius TaxID=1455 RepID=A0ABR5AXP4_BACBA|nr:monovalent cation/H(+) antiporter subunit G [Bacillus badius]KIL75929.1 Na(+) H(+) antiporter subunit G [Bacillus badius]KIL79511.1 Na(+) H(+) antiporter subunit G [Bacillus badius]KZO00448.1 Na+/H+ antiporter subunit G [Bacillus badius]KZR59591.1 Na+/H+ antiporter subunit G [Bacillus badius]MED0667778.1 monovalent cation/H(+) antiporter subunit G [Bacillus badius]